jgi:hypothetical protein
VKSRSTSALLAALFASASVAGCAAGTPSASGANDGVVGLLEAAKAEGLGDESPTVKRLADGVVTLEEYNQGVADQVSCLQDHGYVVTNQYVNKLDSWRILVQSEPGNAEPPGSADSSTRCSVEFVKYLEIGYSLTATNRIDARLLADAQPCLTELNPPPIGTEQSVAELGAVTGNREGVVNCLWVSLQRLYPDEGMVDAQ